MSNDVSHAFELAPWRSPLARALHRNRSQPHHRFFQLATVTPDGFPKNRTVVFRGFLEQTNDLKIITDRRSHKIQELAQCNRAEIAWYFVKTREQFRLAGEITVVSVADVDAPLFQERQNTWQAISENGRSQFAWPNPAAPRTDSKEAFEVEDIDPKIPLDDFVLLVLKINAVDHLELRGDPQNRCLYQLQSDHTWQKIEVNP